MNSVLKTTLLGERQRLVKRIEAIDLLLTPHDQLEPIIDQPASSNEHISPANQPQDVQQPQLRSPLKIKILEYINSASNPLTMRDLQNQFNIAEIERLNFGATIRAMRDSKLIACVKYERNNNKTYYGDVTKLGEYDFLTSYKTPEMMVHKKPMIL